MGGDEGGDGDLGFCGGGNEEERMEEALAAAAELVEVRREEHLEKESS